MMDMEMLQGLVKEAELMLKVALSYYQLEDKTSVTVKAAAFEDALAMSDLIFRLSAAHEAFNQPSALSAPEPDAMEMSTKAIDEIERTMLALNSIEVCEHFETIPEIQKELAIPYLAALIESHSKRVPRAMLEDAAEIEAGLVEYYGEYTKLTDATKKAIADKYGYRAE